MASLRDRVLSNCRKGPGQFQPNGVKVRVYQKISPEVVHDLLDAMRGPNQHKAKALLMLMGTVPWHIGATAHEGGRAKDAPLHITVFAPRGHHLNCKARPDETLYVTDITVAT